MDACLLHCLNHCTKTAAAIKRNNEQLKAQAAPVGDPPRDQGFTRPRVSIPGQKLTCIAQVLWDAVLVQPKFHLPQLGGSVCVQPSPPLKPNFHLPQLGGSVHMQPSPPLKPKFHLPQLGGSVRMQPSPPLKPNFHLPQLGGSVRMQPKGGRKD